MIPDLKTTEQLVEIIVREVLVSLSEQQARAVSGPECDQCKFSCADGMCVRTCFDRAGKVVSAGAERLTSTMGVIPQDPNLAKTIDHTLLKPDATPDQIAQLCFEARKYGFASVCINPAWVKLSAQLLEGSPVKVCTVIGFPLGASAPEVKIFECQNAIEHGALEIDMVLNIGALKARDLDLVARDIRDVVTAAHARGAIVKVIIEAAADRRGKDHRLPPIQRGRSGLCENLHRVCRRRRHRSRRSSDAARGGARYGREGRGRSPHVRRRGKHDQGRSHAHRRERGSEDHSGSRR
jgi:deoxyribose-phosphate aldolase